MLRVTGGFRHETRYFFGCTTSVPRLLQRRRNKVGLHERSELGKRWGRAECCWAEPASICSTPCASSEVVWHYCSANFTPRFELPPVQINACPGVESTRFWQKNNFHRDHVADVWGRSRTWILTSDEVHFHLNGSMNKQNSRYWSTINPRQMHEHPLHCDRLTVWVSVAKFGVKGPYFF